MSLKQTLLAGAAGVVLAGGTAMADEPMKLTDTQMDDVTAGFTFAFGSTGGFASFFFSADDDGRADLDESSTTSTTDSASVVAGSDGSVAASGSSTTDANAQISGNFRNTTLGEMSSFGTLAFGGFL